MINEQQQTIRFRIPDPDELSVDELKTIKTGLDEVKTILYVTRQHIEEQRPKWYQFWKFKKYNEKVNKFNECYAKWLIMDYMCDCALVFQPDEPKKPQGDIQQSCQTQQVQEKQ